MMKCKIITAFLLSWISLGAVSLKPEIVDDLLQSYYSVGQALANDDLKSAQEFSIELLSKVGGGHAGHEHKSMPISNAAEMVASAQDINQAREAFKELSAVLIKTVGSSGTIETSRGVIVNCSMAFDGNGAQWIQQGTDISNPYFGKKMLRCGNIVDSTIVTENDASCCSSGGEEPSSSCHSSEKNSTHHLIPASAQTKEEQLSSYPDTCVVSDEPLIEGEVQDYEYDGQLVRFCCKGCKGDFLKDPKHYLSKIEKLKHSDDGSDHSNEHDHSSHQH